MTPKGSKLWQVPGDPADPKPVFLGEDPEDPASPLASTAPADPPSEEDPSVKSEGSDRALRSQPGSRSTVQTEATLVGGERTWLRSGFDLHIIEPTGERRIPVCYTHMTLGSSHGPKTNDIYLNHPGIANRQAVFKLIQENLYFSNVSTATPTFINNVESTFRQLSDLDEVRIGPVRIKIIKLSEAVAFLEGYSEPHRKQHWTLGAGRTTIGRVGKRLNQVELTDPTVSREHATIEYSEGLFVLRPEKTSTATWVNAEPVGGMRVLQDEDLIQVGQQLLRFRTYRANPKPRELTSRSATILFSDIWDYTGLAESRPLEEVIGQVNEMYKVWGG